MVAVNFTKNLPVLDPALLVLLQQLPQLQQLQQLQLPEVVKSFLEENLLHSGENQISTNRGPVLRFADVVFIYSGD